MTRPKRILFIHPDLGIGGAERLVVDAAVGLQDRGHQVTVYTSHCDPRHCFDEARNGTLRIRVEGNSIIPPNILGRFSILCAILRQLHLSLNLLFTGEISNYDYIFIDQLSACIPIFYLFAPKIKILFYCHFPDYLLATRASVIKSLYRIPFDWFESLTTGLADTIVVNSRFTKSVFATAFPRIKLEPRVVYPCVDISEAKGPLNTDEPLSLGIDGKKIILSINRFERKKNVALAIQAYALLNDQGRAEARLVVAGGYDPRVHENISYHNELVSLCDSLNLKHVTCKNLISALSIPQETEVLFLLSIPATWKSHLLHTSSLLAYTPEREHFGIVPLEALLAELPVLAHNSGGPRETVAEGQTGWLRAADPAKWAEVMRLALFTLSNSERKEMGRIGKQKVIATFSKEKMAERLEQEFELAPKTRRVGTMRAFALAGGICVLAAAVIAGRWRFQL